VQRKHYGQDWSFVYQWLLVLSTQLVGFSMGGVAKRFLVSPPSMSACLLTLLSLAKRWIIAVWPANLVTCALFNTLHSQVYSGFRDTGMSRERFFLYGFLASFIWCECACAFVLFVAKSILRFLSWISVHRSVYLLLGKLSTIGAPSMSVRLTYMNQSGDVDLAK
jgi:hypothetical protein